MLPPVLICGNSLLLAGIETALRDCARLMVLHISLVQIEAYMSQAVGTCVVVYDQAELTLLRQPGWPAGEGESIWIGLDAQNNRVAILTRQNRTVAVVGEVLHLILQVVESSPASLRSVAHWQRFCTSE